MKTCNKLSQSEIALLLEEASEPQCTYERRTSIYHALRDSIPSGIGIEMAQALLHKAFFGMLGFRSCLMSELFPLCALLCAGEMENVNAGEDVEARVVLRLPKIDWQYVDTTGVIAWRKFSVSSKNSFGGSGIACFGQYSSWSRWRTERKWPPSKIMKLQMKSRKDHTAPPSFGLKKEFCEFAGISIYEWAHSHRMDL